MKTDYIKIKIKMTQPSGETAVFVGHCKRLSRIQPEFTDDDQAAAEKLFKEIDLTTPQTPAQRVSRATPPPPIMSLRLIQKTVCDFYNVTPVKLFGTTRTHSLARVRSYIAYFARKYISDCSLSEIGRFLGRDHTSIIAAVERVKGYLKDAGNKKAFELIEAELQKHTGKDI